MIKKTTHSHWRTLEKNIRKIDLDEVLYWYSNFEDMKKDHMSLPCKKYSLFTKNNRLMGIGGVRQETNVQVPFLLTTYEVETNARELYKDAKEILNMYKVTKSCPMINFVHKENTKAVRWLEFLGFKVHPANKFGSLRKFEKCV